MELTTLSRVCRRSSREVTSEGKSRVFERAAGVGGGEINATFLTFTVVDVWLLVVLSVFDVDCFDRTLRPCEGGSDGGNVGDTGGN